MTDDVKRRGAQETLEQEWWSPAYRQSWLLLPVCAECGRKLRPQGAGKKEWPETVSRTMANSCQSDYKRLGAAHFKRLKDEQKWDREVEEALLKAAAAPPVRDDRTLRQRLADGWTVAERRVALGVCRRFSVADSEEVLSTLGLFDPNRAAGAQYFGQNGANVD